MTRKTHPLHWELLLALLICAVVGGASILQAQFAAKDPGPRGAPVSAGGFLPGLTSAQQAQASDGAARFVETENFPGGLGPLYNGGPFEACGECHAQPAIGGSSPSTTAFPFVGPNPQATLDYDADGATNTLPSFITANGPVREARFVQFPNGQPDGGVHDLFSVTGRADAPTCTLAQPDFADQLAAGNVIFRIPLPVFGDGLIENIDDATIIANQQANAAQKSALGISGMPNRSGNDNTITRFGWKAQNKSLLMFSGEAYVVEVGVSNELFGTKRPEPGTELPPGCKITATPDDTSNPGSVGVQVLSDIEEFAAFIRDLAPPTPAPPTPSTLQGERLFSSTGCALCHTPTMMTAKSNELTALSSVPANLFSDLLIHNMGTGLADGVTQGLADGQHFRTAPLWGLGQRVFFLHDGRTSDLVQAIKEHASPGSEANAVIKNFNNLTPQQQQDLLNFLRSL
jgi:CxxC motif-containing protein (DUF1111 family)